MSQTKEQNPVRARLLVVDDEPRMRESLARFLVSACHQVDTASNGLEAVSRIESTPYDLILLDLMMPGLTGHQVMEFIRQKEIDTQIIVISGDVAIDSAISAIRQGAYDFVRKPYEPDEILRRIENALGSRRLEIENRDMTSRLRRSEHWHRYLVNNSLDMIFVLDSQGRFTFVNDAVKSMLGYSRKELIGQHYTSVVHNEDQPDSEYHFNERRTGARATHGMELRLKRKENTRLAGLGTRFVPVELNAMGIYEKDVSAHNRFVGTYGVVRDIAERKQAEKTIAYQAYHDMLTGLPNRALFLDRLSQAINQAKRNNNMLAVMFIDLDKFKFVNDSLGHVAGDKLLKALATRMKSCLREVDTLARLGGDEFILLLPHINTTSDATVIAEKILHTLEQKFIIGDHELFASVSIGIALYPDDGDSSEALIKHADVAMYHAKSQGRNNYQIFAYTMDAQSSGRLALVHDLHHALARSEFEVHYHPQVDARSGRIVGLEALLRWNHPTLGLLAPAHFIYLAEETGLVSQIGDWVLQTVCHDTRQWHESGTPMVRTAINISPQQIYKTQFADKFLELLAEHEIDPALIGIEITESTIMKDVDNTVPKLRKLSEHGIEISLDDFGTGYSSLSYLNKLPIHALKVDQSFVREMPHNPGHASIVAAIATMARGLQLRLIVEGVETKEQLDSLARLGCDEYQGFLFAQPLPPDQAGELLAANLAAREPQVQAQAG